MFPSWPDTLDSKQLASLLSLGDDTTGGSSSSTAEARAQVVESFLDKLAPAVLSDHRSISDSFCASKTLRGSATVRQRLFDQDSDVESLKVIKRQFKHCCKTAVPRAEADASNVIYFASIASALVNRGVLITSRSYKELARDCGLLSGKKWLPSNLTNLFAAAHTICFQRANGCDAQR